MVEIGDRQTAELYCGTAGIKTASVGDTTVYDRPGGYIFLELYTEKES